MKTRLSLKSILCFLSVLFVCQTFAQNDSIKFTGTIFDRETLEPLSDAVYLKHNNTFSIHNNGNFQLILTLGDTVTFSHLGYQDLTMVASDSLQLRDYLTGIYLSKETYLLSEVMVFPRQYALGTLVATTPVKTSQNQKAAERNLRISTYQGLRPPDKMDNLMNQKMTLYQHRLDVEYKAMVSPDRIAGINMVTIVPETEDYLSDLRKRDIHIDLGAITTEEEKNYLKSVFVAFQKEMEYKQKQKTQD